MLTLAIITFLLPLEEAAAERNKEAHLTTWMTDLCWSL